MENNHPRSGIIFQPVTGIAYVGIEGDGVYGIDRDPSDFDLPFEEVIALSAVRGFETPALIRGDLTRVGSPLFTG